MLTQYDIPLNWFRGKDDSNDAFKGCSIVSLLWVSRK